MLERMAGTSYSFVMFASPGTELIVVVVIVLFLGALLWPILRQKAKAYSAESWPTTEARIESCYVTVVRGGRNSPDKYYPVLQYSYVMQGERYAGSFQLSEWNADRDAAAEVGRGWVGDSIRIRYKPQSPDVSIWLQQDGAPAGPIASAPSGSDDGMIDPELNK